MDKKCGFFIKFEKKMRIEELIVNNEEKDI